MPVTLDYADGTVRVGGDADAYGRLPYVERDDRTDTGRVPGYRYGPLRDHLRTLGTTVEDSVPRWEDLDVASTYDLRDYQRDALDAWEGNDERGVVELPTGAGKTVLALKAIERSARVRSSSSPPSTSSISGARNSKPNSTATSASSAAANRCSAT